MEFIDRRTFLLGVGVSGSIASAMLADVNHLTAPRHVTGAKSAIDVRSHGDADRVQSGIPIESLSSSVAACFVINATGSYFLSSHLRGQAGKHGIEIRASDVRIEFGGNSFTGVPGACSGVVAVPGVHGCILTNGHIVDWPRVGVDLRRAAASGVSGFVVRGNVKSGICVGASSQVNDCACSSNGGWGIEASKASMVRGCFCDDNRAGGILVREGCRVLNNSISSSPRGVTADCACHIEGNTTSGNAVGVIVTGRDSLVIRNASRDAASFSIASGNAYGPLVYVAGVGALSAAANSEHPWANFSYAPSMRPREVHSCRC